MKKYIKNRWFIVCCIWICVVILTCWNITSINRIIDLRKKIINFNENKNFTITNNKKIEEVSNRKDGLYQIVASLQFGFLSAENYLETLSKTYNQTDMKIKYDKDISNSLSMGDTHINISFSSSLPDLIKYLNQLENNCSYLTPVKVKACFTDKYKTAQYEVVLLYKYRFAFHK